MGLPRVGEPFPDFEHGDFSTRGARSKGPVLLVVWRTECPTCRLALPFFERMHRAYPSARVVGIAQNQPDEAAQYCGANAIGFLNLPDTTLRVTRGLGVTIVPSYWLVGKSGEVLLSGIGWDRSLIEQFASKLASLTGAFYAPVVSDADGVPPFKPG